MELGSEFSLEVSQKQCKDNVFHFLRRFETIYMDSGRSALKLLRQILPSGKILLPSYICESVYSCFPTDCVCFYLLTQDLQVDWNNLFQQLNDSVSVVYLHYFNGILPSGAVLQKLRDARAKYKFQIIEDTTHSIFSSPLTIGDFAICSLRKWFPIPDGGVLYGRNLKGLTATGEAPWVRAKIRAMQWKQTYLSDEKDQSLKMAYRKVFAACDNALTEQQDGCLMSDVSKEILENYSISQMISARIRNTEQIKKVIVEECSWLHPLAWTRENEMPLTFPIMVQDRDALRAYLISKDIYCAVHWPLKDTPMEALATSVVSDHELSFPIDQRYGAGEMEYLLNCLRCYGEMIYAKTNQK